MFVYTSLTDHGTGESTCALQQKAEGELNGLRHLPLKPLLYLYPSLSSPDFKPSIPPIPHLQLHCWVSEQVSGALISGPQRRQGYFLSFSSYPSPSVRTTPGVVYLIGGPIVWLSTGTLRWLTDSCVSEHIAHRGNARVKPGA
jgi:hypothetical protein